MVSCSESSTLSTYAVMSVTLTAYSSSHSCVQAPGGGVVVYPWSPCDVMSGKSRSRDARYSVGPLLASCTGWWCRRVLDKCVQGAPSRDGGRGGAHCGESARSGSAESFAMGSRSGGVWSLC